MWGAGDGDVARKVAAADRGTDQPDGVNEVLKVLKQFQWAPDSLEEVSVRGSVRTWRIVVGVGTMPSRFNMEFVVVDDMPNNIRVSLTTAYPAVCTDARVFPALEEFAVRATFLETSEPSSGTSTAPAVHLHVTCDGCGMFPIVGDRYKCTVRDNFDLCTGCEASRKFSSFPMLKIRTPSEQLNPSRASPLPSRTDADVGFFAVEPRDEGRARVLVFRSAFTFRNASLIELREYVVQQIRACVFTVIRYQDVVDAVFQGTRSDVSVILFA